MKSKFLLILFCALRSAAFVRGADESVLQRVVPAPTAEISRAEQQHAVRALSTARREIGIFLSAFPKARVRVWRMDPKSPRVRIDFSTAVRGEYLIGLWYDALFDPKFTKVEDSRCEFFGIVLLAAKLHPGEAEAPINLQLAEMDALCASTDAFIAEKVRGRKKG